MSKLVPKYTLWDGLNVAIQLGMRALEEIRTLARTPGPRGADGLGFDDLEIIHDGERSFTFRMVRGEHKKDFTFRLPVAIYRGVFREGEAYKQGDTVTWGGHLYHCDTDTSDKPDGEQRCWTLAVRRGRDGKDTKPVKV